MSPERPRASLDDIREVPDPGQADKPAKKEAESAFSDLPTFTTLRNQRFKEQTDQLRREHWLRVVTTTLVIGLVVGWLLIVLGIVIGQGLKLIDLGEKVLVALLATTSINVIGLLAVVVRYLFPREPRVFGHYSMPSVRQKSVDRPQPSSRRPKPKD